MPTDTILIVDDEADLLRGLKRFLGMELDCRSLTAETAREALKILETHPVDLILADIQMPEMDGFALLREVKAWDPAITVIMMTAYGTIEKAVEAIKNGAYDFIQKPIDEERLLHLLNKGLELNRLVRENARLMEQMCLQDSFANMVGRSRPMRSTFEKIRMLAQSDATVLIQGETGTGKELAALAIHDLSGRGNRKLITVNCPALPETILESELFGYRKGAFTDAREDRRGLFHQAHGSSIFLDEIGDLSPAVQTKLLRVLQDKKIHPLSASDSHTVDVRILAATNQNLKAKMKQNLFRKDLFYRLDVVTLMMPPLRGIREDIPLLVDHFLELVACEQNKPRKTVTPEVLDVLLGRDWPGNTRQLENLIRGWYAITGEQEISLRHLRAEGHPNVPRQTALPLDQPYQDLKDRAIASFSREYLERLLGQTQGNISSAAQISGMKRQSLQKIIKRYGINVTRFRERSG
ncbi:Response regulator of zinc sigma-54-dependent two-component system [Olavius algarvensis associated proteobacterium Delta 3]|nr:Response regulator of zinc sigma-54-dependent two-component system [Olavius algarvensis associated proteobacterium Delta 3]CAB5142434.1 Response regulator of zinc sigma-54-dependent two-component system [Olavius algarvensis associated proteobacterium Delta 3]